MFIRHSGKTKLIDVAITPSTAMSAGSLLIYSANNLADLATSASTSGALIGVLRKEIKPSDSDYADSRSVLVEVPVEKNVEWEADTTGSTYGVGDEVDLSTSKVLNLAAQSVKVARIRKVPKSGKAFVVLSLGGDY